MNPNNFDAIKITDKSFVTVGETINYSIVLTNGGTVPNTSIILTDLIPQGADFVDNSISINNVNIPNSNPALGVTIPNMAVGAITTVTFQALAVNPPAINTMQNVGQIDYQYTLGVSIFTTSIYTNTVSTVNNTALLTLTKSAPVTASVGQTIIFTTTVLNVGNVTATGGRFIDTIPVGTTFVPGSVVVNGAPNVGANPSPPLGFALTNINPAGGIRVIRFSVNVVSVPPNNLIQNVADATYNYLVDPVTIRNVSTRASSNISTTTLAFANLSGITKLVDKAFATCGDILNYTITIPNTGPLTATNVVVSDTLSNGLIYVPGTLFINCTPSGNPLNNINVGTIAPGGISTVTFKVMVNC